MTRMRTHAWSRTMRAGLVVGIATIAALVAAGARMSAQPAIDQGRAQLTGR
ncbi:MAG: hypothetical protein QM736_14360 [Vicinamibacterales bacterium]